ncbi:MAG TPA: TetR family transcriptional regulator [Solirubrobacteraceae bacterium]|jgi:AcrR family transcriptional regulator|nr:TetR family transcriptional regulator [Solirubrobacteraceae bacterium]
MDPTRQGSAGSAVGIDSGCNGLGRDKVSEIQRARIISAMVEVVADRGVADATIAHVVARSGISRRTFYELFADREDCFLATFDDAVERATEYVREAYAIELDGRSSRWRERIRVGLLALLEFFDDEPSMGRLVVVDALGAGGQALDRRQRLLAQLIAVVDEGRSEVRVGTEMPPLTAEGVVGGVFSLIHIRLLERRPQRFVDLLNPLMGMIVLPYLGPAAARKELDRPTPAVRGGRPKGIPRDPFKNLEMRLTYRTIRALMAVAANPGASNRDVADASGVSDQGQMSKLLGRLDHLGLIHNAGAGRTRGEPNAWTLTDAGREVERALGLEAIEH